MGWDLATDTDPLDDGAVPVDVRLGQVLQQPTTLTDEDAIIRKKRVSISKLLTSSLWTFRALSLWLFGAQQVV